MTITGYAALLARLRDPEPLTPPAPPVPSSPADTAAIRAAGLSPQRVNFTRWLARHGRIGDGDAR